MSLINTPLLTASFVAIVVTVGIAKPKAWGQAITKTVIAKVKLKTNGWPIKSHQIATASKATIKAMSVNQLEALSASR